MVLNIDLFGSHLADLILDQIRRDVFDCFLNRTPGGRVYLTTEVLIPITPPEIEKIKALYYCFLVVICFPS